MEQNDSPYRVVYRERSFAVLSKRAGILSQTDRGGDADLLSLYEKECKKTCYPVHRLDRGVGGLLVVATSREAAARLSASLGEDGGFRKEYLAVVHGTLDCHAGELSGFLFHDERKRRSYLVPEGTKGAKPVRLGYRVLSTAEREGKSYSLLAVLLHTGRTHQIRAQFSDAGHPIAGDGRYGASDRFPPIGLHAARLTFPNPVTGEEMTFTDLPSGGAFSLFAVPDPGKEGFFVERNE